MALVFGPGVICGIVMNLMVEVKDREDTGEWNHLLLSKNTPVILCGGEDGVKKLAVSGEVHLSWSQVKDELPFKEGEYFRARITADCNAGGGIDESITAYWAAYRVWTCDINGIEILK